MAGELIAGLGVFKTMLDMAKGLKNINDAAIRNGAVIELQEQILAAQAQQSALVERIGGLEKEMARFETWDAEKKRYELKNLGGDTFAYVLKEKEANGEPPHRICAACYENGRKSILQFDFRTHNAQDRYNCPACKTQFEFGVRQNRPLPSVNRGGGWTA